MDRKFVINLFKGALPSFLENVQQKEEKKINKTFTVLYKPNVDHCTDSRLQEERSLDPQKEVFRQPWCSATKKLWINCVGNIGKTIIIYYKYS
jgi:hypothetical protein